MHTKSKICFHKCIHNDFCSCNIFLVYISFLLLYEVNKQTKEILMLLWMNINWYLDNYHKDSWVALVYSLALGQCKRKKKFLLKGWEKNVLHFHTSETVYILTGNSVSLDSWRSSSNTLVNMCWSNTHKFILDFM